MEGPPYLTGATTHPSYDARDFFTSPGVHNGNTGAGKGHDTCHRGPRGALPMNRGVSLTLLLVHSKSMCEELGALVPLPQLFLPIASGSPAHPILLQRTSHWDTHSWTLTDATQVIPSPWLIDRTACFVIGIEGGPCILLRNLTTGDFHDTKTSGKMVGQRCLPPPSGPMLTLTSPYLTVAFFTFSLSPYK